MQFNQQPFQSQIDTAFFFAGGSRREIVDAIKTALIEGVPLITLTGTEGSGKSMVCRMVEQELQEGLLPLYLDRTVESFDELVGNIASTVGIEEDEKQADSKALLAQVVDILVQEDRRLVIILDKAEKIFLATLERIRRILDQVNTEDTLIQLLFSGQPLFSLNFKQLSIVSFKETQEKHFNLDPLDFDATCRYLNHCMDLATGEEKDFFTPEIAEKITLTARGNFRLTNQLADQYLKTGKIVDLTEIYAVIDGEEPVEAGDKEALRSMVSTGLANVDLDFLKVPKIKPRWYFLGGAVVVALFLIFLYSGSSDEEVEVDSESTKVPELLLKKVEPETPPPLQIKEEKAEQVVKKPETSKIQEKSESAAFNEEKPGEKKTKPDDSMVITKKAVAPKLTRPIEETRPEKVPEPQTQVHPEVLPKSEGIEVVTKVDVAPIVTKPVEETKPEKVPEPQTQRHPEVMPKSEEIKVVTKVDVAPKVTRPVEETKPEKVPEPQIQPEPETTSKPVTPVAKQASSEPDTTIITPTQAEPVIVAEIKEEVENTGSVKPLEKGVNQQDAVSSEEKRVDTAKIQQEPKKVEERAEAEQEQSRDAIVADQKKQIKQMAVPTVVTLQNDKKKQPIVTTADNETIETKPPQVAVKETNPEPEPEAIQKKSIPILAEEQVEPLVAPQVINQQPEEQNIQAGSAVRGNQLYSERLAAGARWLVGSGRGKHTVQLMVLASDDSEQNLKEMLGADGFQRIRNQLYIMRRVGSPPTVMLFFGEYGSEADAQQAQNSLPGFLQNLSPYSLSIEDAVKKAKGGE